MRLQRRSPRLFITELEGRSRPAGRWSRLRAWVCAAAGCAVATAGGCVNDVTTLAIGEEGGVWDVVTLAIGESGGL